MQTVQRVPLAVPQASQAATLAETPVTRYRDRACRPSGDTRHQSCDRDRAAGHDHRSLTDADRERLGAGASGDRSLALARSIVEMHPGTLRFEFPADGGVRAVVTFPTQLGRAVATS
jgi:hypothetical protein